MCADLADRLGLSEFDPSIFLMDRVVTLDLHNFQRISGFRIVQPDSKPSVVAQVSDGQKKERDEECALKYGKESVHGQLI